jgi:hypothetical protein
MIPLFWCLFMLAVGVSGQSSNATLFCNTSTRNFFLVTNTPLVLSPCRFRVNCFNLTTGDPVVPKVPVFRWNSLDNGVIGKLDLDTSKNGMDLDVVYTTGVYVDSPKESLVSVLGQGLAPDGSVSKGPILVNVSVSVKNTVNPLKFPVPTGSSSIKPGKTRTTVIKTVTSTCGRRCGDVFVKLLNLTYASPLGTIVVAREVGDSLTFPPGIAQKTTGNGSSLVWSLDIDHHAVVDSDAIGRKGEKVAVVELCVSVGDEAHLTPQLGCDSVRIGGGGRRRGMIAGITIGVLLIVSAAAGMVVFIAKRKIKRSSHQDNVTLREDTKTMA